VIIKIGKQRLSYIKLHLFTPGINRTRKKNSFFAVSALKHFRFIQVCRNEGSIYSPISDKTNRQRTRSIDTTIYIQNWIAPLFQYFTRQAPQLIRAVP
jgi:hypothetical protein